MLFRSKGSSDWEGWVSSQANFANGVHRQLTVMTEFRNLTFPGVHFGRLSTSKSCVADGDTDPTGSGNCCSGYMDSTGKCLSMEECSVSGTSMSESQFYQCCSHKVYNGSCA